jgi:hypothetical protein
MCRSIHTLRSIGGPASEAEIQAAAIQYVRKVSGYRKPSRANQAAFERAVADVALATQTLLASLTSKSSSTEVPVSEIPQP